MKLAYGRNPKAGTLSRRRVLRGLGGLALGLPWLEKLEGTARAQTPGPKRVIVMTYAMGVPLGAWRPSGSGASLTLPYVTEPLQPFLDRSLLVSAIDNRVLETGGDPFVWGHPAKQEAALTGTLTTGAFESSNDNQLDEVRRDAVPEGAANNASVEHLIGQFVRNGQSTMSVDLGVDGDSMAEWGGQQPTQTSLFCFEGKGNAISLTLQPWQAFDNLFGGLGAEDGPSPEQEALRHLRARNKSVLDAVRDSFVELRQGLNAADQQRLDDHAARIRQIELDLQQSATCSIPGAVAEQPSLQGMRMDEQARTQITLLSRAMACDLAPVGRLEFVNQQNPRFGKTELDATLDSVSDYDWHAMVHGDALPGTTQFLRPGRDDDRPDYDSRLLDGYRFFVEQYAALLGELDAIPEGPDTSVLDNSLLVLASDLGEGLGHGMGKMGYILSGNLGGARTAFHLDAGPAQTFEPGGSYFYAQSKYNVNQLLNSILDMAGVVDDQGAPVTIGLQGYLESIGTDRRIDELFA
jgi:hypothetical protein